MISEPPKETGKKILRGILTVLVIFFVGPLLLIFAPIILIVGPFIYPFIRVDSLDKRVTGKDGRPGTLLAYFFKVFLQLAIEASTLIFISSYIVAYHTPHEMPDESPVIELVGPAIKGGVALSLTAIVISIVFVHVKYRYALYKQKKAGNVQSIDLHSD